MSYFLIFLLIHGVVGHFRHGESYQDLSILCRPWACVNNHFFNESISVKHYKTSIQKRLPIYWHPAAGKAVDICYKGSNKRQYTSTCPGQAFWHCLVDNLIEHCPEARLQKNDACAPVDSTVGFVFMFSQSRYDNLAKHLPFVNNPEFHKDHFNETCCNLPSFVGKTVLKTCGFEKFLHNYEHKPPVKSNLQNFAAKLQMPFNTMADLAPAPTKETVRVVDFAEVDDVMSCCDLSDFVHPYTRGDCNFKTEWDPVHRLVIKEMEPNLELATTTTTPKPEPVRLHDVKVVPLNCQSEICVFSQLNISTTDGKVDKAAFVKLLDKWTETHKEWSSAKARVITMCLSRSRPLVEYKADCELNSVLACTFDVLSENCPHSKRTSKDPCKHLNNMTNNTVCQINSTKYRPKNRRLFCDFPQLVDYKALAQCNLSSIYKIESVPEVTYRKPTFKKWFSNKVTCKESTQSSLCLMSKMGVLNKYNFMDYFKMKDKIRRLSENDQWGPMSDVYMSTLNTVPLYRDHCASQRKLLNVLDAMIMTCPANKRQNTSQCNKMFQEIAKNYTQTPLSKINQIYQNMFLKYPPKTPPPPTKKSNKKMHPILEYGMFGNAKVPPVRVIPIKPQVMTKENRRPLIVLPVYSRPKPYSTTTNPVTPPFVGFESGFYSQPESFPSFPPSALDHNVRFPRDHALDANKYGPFHQDALLRSGIHFERPFTNGHSGNELDLEMDEGKPE